jgi:Cytochrome P450
MSAAAEQIPYFDISDPSFSMTSEQVLKAREQSWYARTNYGIAVLRYDEVNRLLKDRRLCQGSRQWAERNGVGGPWADWWRLMVLNVEGEDHARLRRLLNPAFSPRLLESLVPRFQKLASGLIDDFIDDGGCEFMSQFAEPYAAQVIAILLGIPRGEWRVIAEMSNALGLSTAVTIKDHLAEVEAALKGLYGYADALIADRLERPRDDFMTRLVHAHSDHDRLTREELRVHVVLLIFGGMDTTRNQLGLGMQTFLEHPDQWEQLAARPELGKAAVEDARGDRGRRVPGGVDRGRDRDPPVRCLSRDRPAGRARPGLRHHRGAPEAVRFRRRSPPLHRPLHRAQRHERSADAARAPAQKSPPQRSGALAAGERKHRPDRAADRLRGEMSEPVARST